MKNTLIICALFAATILVSCKGNPNTTAGDSTGTGAGGARVPGNTVSDTTKHDSTQRDSAKK
jgi:hypothetical protein